MLGGYMLLFHQSIMRIILYIAFDTFFLHSVTFFLHV